MMRAYLGLSLGLSLCLMCAVGCGGDGTSNGGSGGTAGTGGSAGTGGGGGGGPASDSKELSLGCANSSPIGAQSVLSATLDVSVTETTAGAELDADLTGSGVFPVAFLDAAQGLIQGGVAQAILADARYVAQVRSGATLVNPNPDVPGVALGPDLTMITPGEVRFCTYPEDQECTADSDCLVAPCTDPVLLVDLPTSDDCAPGGVCEGLGKTDGPQSQCGLNDFCITGDLILPLETVTATYMADATGPLLFGWADQGLMNNTFDSGTSLYTIPKPSASDPIEQGLKVDVGITVGVECVMGTDQGEDPMNPDNTLIGLTPDADLISFPLR